MELILSDSKTMVIKLEQGQGGFVVNVKDKSVTPVSCMTVEEFEDEKSEGFDCGFELKTELENILDWRYLITFEDHEIVVEKYWISKTDGFEGPAGVTGFKIVS